MISLYHSASVHFEFIIELCSDDLLSGATVRDSGSYLPGKRKIKVGIFLSPDGAVYCVMSFKASTNFLWFGVNKQSESEELRCHQNHVQFA